MQSTTDTRRTSWFGHRHPARSEFRQFTLWLSRIVQPELGSARRQTKIDGDWRVERIHADMKNGHSRFRGWPGSSKSW